MRLRDQAARGVALDGSFGETALRGLVWKERGFWGADDVDVEEGGCGARVCFHGGGGGGRDDEGGVGVVGGGFFLRLRLRGREWKGRGGLLRVLGRV